MIKDNGDGTFSIKSPIDFTQSPKSLSEAIEIIRDFQNSDVPPYKYYEDTYADGWMDACNEIMYAIQERIDNI